MADNTTTKDLIITWVFDAPLEQVWNAWIQPETIMRWWAPEGFSVPSAQVDFREGGTSLVCMRAPQEFGGRDTYSTWHYTKIVPQQSIEYAHSLADKDGQKVDPTTVGMPADFPQDQPHIVRFKDLGNGKTELTITERAWPVGQMMEMSRMGMEQCLNKLAAVLAGK